MAKKDPINNKIRLVYQVDKDGNPISFISLEHSESKKLLFILKYIQKVSDKDRWVYVNELTSKMKVSKNSLLLLLSKLAGVKRIDYFKDGQEIHLLHNPIIVQKGLFNHKTNLPRTPKYLKAPFQVKLSSHIKV